MIDKAVISALKAGDEKAFTLLFEQYSNKLFHYYYRYLKRRDIAKEFTQDVFLKLWKNRTSVNEEHFEAWLFTLAKNHLFDFLRRQVKERDILKETKALATEVAPPSDTPQEQYLYKEALQQYHAVLNELDEQQKNIFLLNKEKGLTYQQIATQLNISVKSVEWNITKTRKLLQQRLQHFITILLILLTQR